MKNCEDIILELLKSNIEVKMVFDKESPTKITYLVAGFYKSGDCALTPTDRDTFIARTRGDLVDEITSFPDIVNLNYNWWVKSRERAEMWNKPSEGWEELLLQLGYVRKRTETVTHYEIMDR